MVSGELPCSREEAATLAGIQQHLDETWPDDTTEDLTQTEDNHEEQEKDRLIRVRNSFLSALQSRTSKSSWGRNLDLLVLVQEDFNEGVNPQPGA